MKNKLIIVASAVLLVVVGGLVVGLQPEAGAKVVVYKTPTCGCCSKWVSHLREAGFEVEANDLNDLSSIKSHYGVQRTFSSCHTAIVEGYVVEGHVPADVVARLLEERPEVAGITVPGMPIGSPGMEGPNAQPYEVLSFDKVGHTEVFARVVP